MIENSSQHRRLWTILVLLVLLLAITFTANLGIGEINLFHHMALSRSILLSIRLPRAIAAFVAGGLLALAGTLMQTLLKNPLADPYILGISGGASVATLLGLLLGFTHSLGLIAFLGSLSVMFLVLLLSKSYFYLSSLRLLLTGVVIATGCGALISFILILAPNRSLHSMLFWLMGDLNDASITLWQPIMLAVGLFISFIFARPLNLIARGEVIARSLGVPTQQLNLLLYFLTSLLTATAVSIAGNIGFIGLIVPHLLRLMGSPDHRFLIPASVLFGGTLLMMADLIARTAFAPIELPVGIITAFIGIPLFLLLLNRGLRS